jgi:probable O-glycosylation ligase (exosortase A-associated)
MVALPRKTQTPEDKEKAGRFLYLWLLLAVFFEYARPGYQYHFLQAVPLNSIIPLSLFLVAMLSGNQRPWSELARDRMWIWPFVMVAFVLVSMAWASVTLYAYEALIQILGYLLLFVLVARIITTMQRLRGLFVTLIVSHLFLLVYNPLVVLDPGNRHYITGATFLGDGNDYSLSLVILIPFAMLLASGAKSRAFRILHYGFLALIILAIIGTQSRGATLGVGAVFGYLWWRSPRKGPALVALAVAAFGVLLYAPDVYVQRLKTIRNPEQESSAEARIKAWQAGARMAQDNLLGVGAGNFPNNFPRYRDADAPSRWMTAHSMYFLALGELGILGLLLILLLAFGNVRANGKLLKLITPPATGPPSPAVAEDIRLLNMLSASALGLAVSGAFLSVTYYPHLFMLTAISICVRHMVSSRYPTTVTTRARGPLAKDRLNAPGSTAAGVSRETRDGYR